MEFSHETKNEDMQSICVEEVPVLSVGNAMVSFKASNEMEMIQDVKVCEGDAMDDGYDASMNALPCLFDSVQGVDDMYVANDVMEDSAYVTGSHMDVVSGEVCFVDGGFCLEFLFQDN